MVAAEVRPEIGTLVEAGVRGGLAAMTAQVKALGADQKAARVEVKAMSASWGRTAAGSILFFWPPCWDRIVVPHLPGKTAWDGRPV